MIPVLIILVLLVIAVFIWKIQHENKAKKNYNPPVASEKIVLPEVQYEQLPAESEKNLRFCLSCGEPNSDRASYCVKCGNKLHIQLAQK